MHVVSRILFWMGLACCAVFVFPVISHQALVTGTIDRMTIGLPGDPYFERTITYTESGAAPNGVLITRERYDMNTRWVSRSSLFLIVGVVLVVANRYLQPHSAQSD